MKKEEIIRLTSLGLIFIFTNLVLKDLLGLPRIAGASVAGVLAGIVSVVWYQLVIKGKSDKFILVLTTIFSVLLLTIAYLHSH